MKTTTPRKTRQARPERKVRIMADDTEILAYTIRLTVGDEVSHYDLCQGLNPAGYPVWLIRKVLESAAESCSQVPYEVDLGHFGPSCTCLGNTHHGHCKHVDALAALTARGLIPDLAE